MSTVWSPLHAQIHQTLKARHLLQQHQAVLIAVSGGQDSVCLAKLLLDLQPKWGWHLAIAHCDHQWREDSAANANHVRQLASDWELPYFQQTANQPLTSEASARTWRYASLADIAYQQNYQAVVTGHTASDRAETLLYNLVRGSGSDGLQGIAWQRPLSKTVMLVRPLLGLSRSQTAEFCQAFHLSIWEDSTNQDLKYARNRIRHEVLPHLKKHLNPNVELALAQTAEILQAEVDFLAQEAQCLYSQSVCEETPFPQFNRCILKNAPIALQRRVVRQILLKTMTTAPTFEHVEKVVALLNAPNRSQTDPFPGGAIAYVSGNWIQFRK